MRRYPGKPAIQRPGRRGVPGGWLALAALLLLLSGRYALLLLVPLALLALIDSYRQQRAPD